MERGINPAAVAGMVINGWEAARSSMSLGQVIERARQGHAAAIPDHADVKFPPLDVPFDQRPGTHAFVNKCHALF